MHISQNPKGWISSENSYKAVLLVGCLVLAVGLLGLVLNGWYARYMQDDYCFDFLLKHHGFWKAQVFTFINEVTFNGNRFSTNLLMGLVAAIGPFSAQILPGLMVLGWLAAGYFLMHEIDHFLGLNWMKPVLFFIAEAIVFFTLVQAPNLFQILYWRPGAVTYLVPLIFITLLAGLGLYFINQDQKNPLGLFLVGLVAFLSGGFSETAAVFLMGLLLLLYLFCIVRKPFDRRNYKNLVGFLSVSLAGDLLSILVLVIAPSAHLRQTALFPHPPEFLGILRISLAAVWQFFELTLYRLTTPTWILLVLFFLIGLGLNPQSSLKRNPNKQNPWEAIGLIFLAAVFLMVCMAAPSAYASSSVPEERALLLARFILVVTGISGSILLGRWVRQRMVTQRTAGFVFIFCLFLVSSSILLVLIIPAQITFDPVYPEIRAWLMQNLWVLLGLAAVVLLVFLLITHRLKNQQLLVKLFPLLLLTMVVLSSLGGLVSVYSALPKFQLRSQLWDWRDAQIRAAIRKGNYEIILPALDSISGVTELQSEADHWVNNCAELFYGMKSIRAVEPVLTRLPDS